ncbi:pollen-specific leucine-rich repeat extensin-like protein 4 [Portunus trituberculatus]|uniref:pollen-specific leucine-rich repeat extensin-like protein 4 n=1 Tax=Portunus trituberculatus TaxID=210409 RepID=UPI001E1CC8A8|nr:pollen-specific leucine-rich repeat extensin-like protein 4 [Portunus trituberculatus]
MGGDGACGRVLGARWAQDSGGGEGRRQWQAGRDRGKPDARLTTCRRAPPRAGRWRGADAGQTPPPNPNLHPAPQPSLSQPPRSLQPAPALPSLPPDLHCLSLPSPVFPQPPQPPSATPRPHRPTAHSPSPPTNTHSSHDPHTHSHTHRL